MIYPDFYNSYRKIWSAMHDLGHPIFLTEGWRSIETQDELYSLGRKPKDYSAIVTYAKPYQSLHHYGIAVDVAFTGEDPYSEDQPWDKLGEVVKAFGCQWGGDWSQLIDRPHIYKDYGTNWQDLSEVYKKYNLEEVWKFLDKKKECKEA